MKVKTCPHRVHVQIRCHVELVGEECRAYYKKTVQLVKCYPIVSLEVFRFMRWLKPSGRDIIRFSLGGGACRNPPGDDDLFSVSILSLGNPIQSPSPFSFTESKER